MECWEIGNTHSMLCSLMPVQQGYVTSNAGGVAIALCNKFFSVVKMVTMFQKTIFELLGMLTSARVSPTIAHDMPS